MSASTLLTCSDRFFLGFREQQRKALFFPNLHASITAELDLEIAYPGHGVLSPYEAEVQIRRDTSLSTISSLVRYPLDWTFSTGQSTRRCVSRITHILVQDRATLTLGQVGRDGLSVPTSAEALYARVSSGIEYGATEIGRLRTSIRAISHLWLKTISPPGRQPRTNELRIDCESPEIAEIWRQEVSCPNNSRMMLKHKIASLLVRAEPRY